MSDTTSLGMQCRTEALCFVWKNSLFILVKGWEILYYGLNDRGVNQMYPNCR